MNRRRIQCICLRTLLACAIALCGTATILTGCQGSPAGSTGESQASGKPFERPTLLLSPFNDADLQGGIDGGGIDISSLSQGYVSAAATNSSKLKFRIEKGDASYNYDLPGDGTPIACPLNMDDGEYTFRIMQNTSGDRYVDLSTPVTATVQLESESAPFMRPSVFCEYDASSAVVKKANELSEGAQNEGEVLGNIYSWITDNIKYDADKAQSINAGTIGTGYVPNPDATLASSKGICFDYAALAAAMLRSQGIPCKIITGEVSPDNIYHAWNLVYLDGSWKSTKISVNPDTWTRIDLTFAAGGASDYAGDGTSYTEKLTY